MTSRPRTVRPVPRLLLVVATAVACGGPAPSAATPPASAPAASAPAGTASPQGSASASPLPAPTGSPVLDRVTGWRADVDALLEARERLHPDPWHGVRREEWIRAAEGVKARIPDLSDEQALVELVRLAAMPSWKGRDGHTGIFPFIPGSGTHELPLRWWRFSDGLVITATGPGADVSLTGQRVVAIGDRPIEDVLALVEPLAPRDNPSNLLAYGPLYLRVVELLVGLGIVDRVGPVRLRVEDQAGQERDVTVAPITPESDVGWNSGQPHRLPSRADSFWLARQDEPLWWAVEAETDALFVQFNAVERLPGSVTDDILARAREDDIRRVIVDLRHNGGGDNRTLDAIERVLTDPAVNRPGHLYLIIGRITFSAAANFAADVEGQTLAVFVGEPMGGSPNEYGDAERVDLPYGNLAFYCATRYWERSTPDDERLTIEPDIPVELSSADYFNGSDPAYEAILDTPIGPG